MVNTCAAFRCTNRASKGSNISFHGFPSDLELRKKWITATKRKNFNPTQHSKLCSEHFTKEDFIFNFGKRSLKANTIPSVFDFPEHVIKEEPREIPETSRLTVNTTNNGKSDSGVEESSTAIKEEIWQEASLVVDCPEHLVKEEPLEISESTLTLNTTVDSKCDSGLEASLEVKKEIYQEIPIGLALSKHLLKEEPHEILTLKEECTVEETTINYGNCYCGPEVSSSAVCQEIPSECECQHTPIETAISTKRRRSQPVYMGDVTNEDLEKPEKFKLMWAVATKTVSRQKKTIMYLRTKVYRLEKRVRSLNDQVTHLKTPKRM